MAVDYEKVIQTLADHEVKFILVGGLAAIIHGSPELTEDVDVVYARDRENIRRLVEALRLSSPYLRGVERGLPFTWDERTVRMGLNFTLDTALGDVDVLGEVAGGRTYEELVSYSAEASAFGRKFLCVGLERLILLKRAAGRPKDFLSLGTLQALLEERRRKEQKS